MTDEANVLDDVVRASLTGAHARFAQRRGRAMRYDPRVAPFFALEDDRDPAAWDDAAALLGPGEPLALASFSQFPEGWTPVFRGEGVQMTGARVDAQPDAEAVVLGPADVPQIMDLIARTEPGPFLPRTIELGTYLGIRRDGVLAAMAGERLRVPGWTEISAVCTDPAYRGQGLASRLVKAVAAGIEGRGETPFLHTSAGNTNAIRLYEGMDFQLRRAISFRLVRQEGLQ